MTVATPDARILMASYAITAPSPARWREANLGLLVDLLRSSATPPSQERYEDARERHGKQNWPAAATLGDTFGSWARATQAALSLARDQTKGIYPLGTKPLPRTGHTRHEAIRAIQKCSRFDGGQWPDQWTYETGAKVACEQARIARADDPRLPGLPRIRKLFGDYATALAAARRDPTWKG